MSGFPPLPALPLLPLPLLPITGHPRFAFLGTDTGLCWTDTFAETDPAKIIWKRCDAGISTASVQALGMFAANRAGKIYVAHGTGLWTFSLGELPQEFPNPPYSQIWALGCDRMAADYFAILARDFTSALDHIYTGNTGGIAKGVQTPEVVWDYGGISFGLDWLVTYPKFLYPLRVLNVTAGGGAITYQGDGTPSVSFANPNAFHKRAGISADFAYCAVRNTVFTSNGATETPLAGITLVDREGIAADPTGTVILARESVDAVPKISTDSGASWTTIASFPKSTGAWYSAIDYVKEGMYAWAAGTVGSSGDAGVWLTDDQAASFWNKTGNLYELLGPDFKPRYLRCWL